MGEISFKSAIQVFLDDISEDVTDKDIFAKWKEFAADDSEYGKCRLELTTEKYEKILRFYPKRNLSIEDYLPWLKHIVLDFFTPLGITWSYAPVFFSYEDGDENQEINQDGLLTLHPDEVIITLIPRGDKSLPRVDVYPFAQIVADGVKKSALQKVVEEDVIDHRLVESYPSLVTRDTEDFRQMLRDREGKEPIEDTISMYFPDFFYTPPDFDLGEGSVMDTVFDWRDRNDIIKKLKKAYLKDVKRGY